MKSKLWIMVIVLILMPLANGLPNFGFVSIEKKDLPAPVKNSAFIADIVDSNEYPELVYVSEDNRALVVDTRQLILLSPVEIEGNIKKVLAEDIDNDGISELIILSDLKIAVYSSDGKLKWEKVLDSPGVDADLMKNADETYQIVIATKDHFYISSFDGILSDPGETDENSDENSELIIANIGLEPSEEIILIRKSSISTYSRNGHFSWKYDFNKPISIACVFSPPMMSILVSLEDGTFYFLDESGKPSLIENAEMNAAALAPFNPSMTDNPIGFFVISPQGEIRAYRYNGEIMGDLTEFKSISNIIPCDLDNRNANPCEIGTYTVNAEEQIIISENGEVSVLIYCPMESCEQQGRNCWISLPLGVDSQGNRITNIETGTKNISFSLIFRVNYGSYLLLMTSEGTLYEYCIFSKANNFLGEFDVALLDIERGDFGKAYRLLEDEDLELAQYYRLDEVFIQKVEICREKLKEEENMARISLEIGLDEKEKGDLKEALQYLSEAYSGFRRANFEDADTVYEEDDVSLTFSDLKNDITQICLDIIEDADLSLNNKRYEDALADYAFVYSYWESYGDDPSVMQVRGKIGTCKDEIIKDAEKMSDQGELEKSREKYDLVIDSLTKVGGFESDIKECKLRRSYVEELIKQERENKIMFFRWLFIIAAIIAITFGIFQYYKKKNKVVSLAILFLCLILLVIDLEEFRRRLLDIITALIAAVILLVLGIRNKSSL